MKKALFIFLATVFTFQNLFSQADQNFQVKTFNSDYYSPIVSLFVKADKKQLQDYLKSHHGIYKYSSNGYHGVTIPSDEVKNLLSQPFIKSSDFTLHRPATLNDTMRVRDNINPVHNGTNPLDTSYTGKGVIIGIIDTGLELNHPDFKDANGKTRVIKLWDQTLIYDSVQKPNMYGYGQIWDSTEINASLCPSVDAGNGHGSTVTGTAAGNGLANGRHKGVAPESSLIIVSNDFNSANWLGTVADAVDYIFKVADTLNMPVVINASIGDYYGSHDGTDPAAKFIDSLINAKPGRLMVCAAGNSGNIGTYHVSHIPAPSDTVFTWFKYNASSALGYGAVFFEGYADTIDLQNMYYAVGANLPGGSYADRGQTNFINVLSHVGTIHTETIMNGPNEIATVDFYAEKQGDYYLLQIHLQEPDSNTYNFRFMSTGNGAIDIWTTSVFGTSNMMNFGLPNSSVLPEIVNYASPDSAKIIVSSFSCGQNTILVGNYYAMQTYLDYNSNTQVLGGTNGNISVNSSRGPSRDNRVKPEIAASGDVHMSAAPLSMIATMIISEPHKVDGGGMHIRNGGTSMASPVVTGIGALALQKCPNLTASEFRSMLTGTAKTDAFTGAVPNMSYGYGKADAFAALVESNFIPQFITGPGFCGNDSLELILDGNYTSYNWNTGDTTSSVWTNAETDFYASVQNEFGCKGKTDTMTTINNPAPVVTITVDTLGMELISSTAATYQWLFNGDTLAGETNQTLDFSSTWNGPYEVYITDANGCIASTNIVLNINSLDEREREGEIISVYPNPTSSSIFITSPATLKSVSLLDATGKLISVISNINNHTFSLDLKNYETGIYFVKAETEDGSYLVKVVRE
jgi:subtilisin family serine protease